MGLPQSGDLVARSCCPAVLSSVAATAWAIGTGLPADGTGAEHARRAERRSMVTTKVMVEIRGKRREGPPAGTGGEPAEHGHVHWVGWTGIHCSRL